MKKDTAKKLTAALLSAGLLAGTCGTALAAEPEIYYNGKPLTLNEPAMIQDGRTLLALRDMAEQMDVDVQWDGANRLATMTYKDTEVILQPDLRRVLVNKIEQPLDVGPQIINDRIYLPTRYLFELMDADVFYRSYPDGSAAVSVQSRDSYINYVIKDGRETKAVRNVASDSTQNPVIMTHDGNVLEMVVNTGDVQLYRTTQTLSRMEQKEEDARFFKEVTGIMEVNGEYYAVLDIEQSKRYVGTGYYPNGDAFLEKIYTPQGEYRFYGSEGYLYTLALESNKGFGHQTVKGYMLDVSGAEQDIKDTAYAFSTGQNKGYGFLTDGQFLLINNLPGEGYVVETVATISDTMQDGKLYYWDDHYYAIGVDTAANGKEELFLTSYTHQGMKAHSYVPVSNLAAQDNQRYIDVVDTVQMGSEVYMLLRTNNSLYLGCYDLATYDFTTEKLTRPYEKFVHADGAMQLYYCDDENYYFLQVK